MERNTITTVEKLQIGDRFYKLGDKSKAVFMKVDSDLNITRSPTRHFAKTDSDRFAQPINGFAKVVFLRTETIEI